MIDSTHVSWTFTNNATVTGNSPELGVWNGFGYSFPSSCAQGATNVVIAQYGGAPLSGDPWLIATAPSGIDFSPNTFATPQNGLIA